MNILIVDDEEPIRTLLQKLLRGVGHGTLAAPDGMEAFGVLQREPVDAIITDIMMPRMDGFRFCQAVRGDDRFKDVPLIVHTSTYNSPVDEKMAMDLGADAFLHKPASVVTILETLQRVTGQPRAVHPRAGMIMPESELMQEYSHRLVAKLEQRNVELAAAEGKFRTLVEQSLVGIYVIQNERFVYVNPKMVEIFGWSAEELTSQPVYSFIVPEDQALARENIQKRISGEATSTRYDLRMLRQSGAVVQVEAHGSRVEYDGQPAILGTLLDVTARRRAEEDIRWLAAIVESADEAIIGEALDGTITSWNSAAARMFGYAAWEIIGQPARLLIPPDHAHEEQEFQARIGRGERILEVETVRVRKDGQRLEVSATVSPIRNARGEVLGASIIVRDITERKRAEAVLREAAETHTKPRVRLDLAALVGFSVGLFGVAAIFKLFEAPLEWSQRHRGTHLNDILGALIILGPLLALFSYRRWQEIRRRSRSTPERKAMPVPLEKGRRRHLRAAVEFAEVMAFGAVVFGLGYHFNVFDPFFEWVWEQRDTVVDELFGTLVFLSPALALFGYRRWMELTGEMVEYQHTAEALRTLHDELDRRVQQRTAELSKTNAALQEEVSERRRAEEALRNSELRFRSVWEHSVDGMRLLDAEGNIVAVNAAYCRLAGRSREELEGQPHTATYSGPRPAAELLEKFRDRFARRAVPQREERRMTFRNHREADLEITNSFFELPGRGTLLLSLFRDVTEHKHAEAALRESEARFAKAFSANPAPMGINTVKDGRILAANDRYCELFGCSREEMIGKTLLELGLYANPDDRALLVKELRATGSVRDREVRFRRKSGEARDTLVSLEQIGLSEAQEPVLVSMFTDITERKRAERVLNEERQLLRTVIDNLPGHIFVKDAAGRYLVSNLAHVRLLGAASEAELLGKTVFDFFPAETAQAYTADDQRLLETGTPVNEREEVYEVDGTPRWSQLTKVPLRDQQGKITGLVGIKNDITPRKQAEEELRWKTTLLEAQMDSAIDGILVVDPAGRKILQNQRLVDLWRLPTEIAAEPDGLRQLAHTASQTRSPEAFLAKVRHLQTHPEEISHDEIELKDGKVLDRYSSPVRGRDGRHYGRIWTFRDITDKQRLASQLRQAQKMEAIGALAGGIAHDFNNVLGAILGNVDLARMLPPGDPGVQESLEAILSASHRAAELVKQILAFSRRQEQQRQVLSLHTVVREALKLLRATVPASIEFKTDVAVTPTVLADPTQIHQVTMNLCTNAWHAMKGRPGVLKVELAELKVDEQFARVHPDLRPGRYVRLMVADNGCGMDAATLERIFEPFFTTKPQGEGTGLGLSVVHGIMKSHDGGIVVQSQPGVGTAFHLYFPVFETETCATSAEVMPVPCGQGQHILFVDDEAPLAKLAKTILERLGYRVTLMTSPAEALAAFAAQPAQFDLVITDFNMPGMNGGALAQKLLEIRPGIPLILSTGYTGTLTPETVAEIGFRELLIKPNSIRTLGEAVHRVLRPPTPARP